MRSLRIPKHRQAKTQAYFEADVRRIVAGATTPSTQVATQLLKQIGLSTDTTGGSVVWVTFYTTTFTQAFDSSEILFDMTLEYDSGGGGVPIDFKLIYDGTTYDTYTIRQVPGNQYDVINLKWRATGLGTAGDKTLTLQTRRSTTGGTKLNANCFMLLATTETAS